MNVAIRIDESMIKHHTRELDLSKSLSAMSRASDLHETCHKHHVCSSAEEGRTSDYRIQNVDVNCMI